MPLITTSGQAVLVFLMILIVAMILWKVIGIGREKKKGWRFSKGTDGNQFYGQLIDGEWHDFEIEGEHYSKHHIRHTILFDSTWKSYPEWTKEYKYEIVRRLHETYKYPEFTIIDKQTGKILSDGYRQGIKEDDPDLLDS